jgi:hypothetical protein
VCSAPYCSRDCQVDDWQGHRTICSHDNPTIGGKFDTKEYTDAIVVSKHVRIIWDSTVPENKARMETNKDKKRIYLHMNRNTSAVYLAKRLNKIEKRRHEQGNAFWEVKKRETKPRDKSPTRPELTKPSEGNEQSLLSALQSAYRKSKKDSQSLRQTFDRILSEQKRQSVDFANDIQQLYKQIDARFFALAKMPGSTGDYATKELMKIRNRIDYWFLDQVFEDVSVEFGELSKYIQPPIKKESYNVKWANSPVTTDGRKLRGFRFHFHGKIYPWMPSNIWDFVGVNMAYLQERLGKTLDEDIVDLLESEIVNFLEAWRSKDLKKDVNEFDIYYPQARNLVYLK